jgi:signal transduction histidine kinase
MVVAGCAMASLAWRRQIPLVCCALVAVANFGFDSVDQLSPFLAMVLVMFTVGSETERHRSCVGLALMLVPFIVLLTCEGLKPSDVSASVVFIAGPWLVGRSNRQRAARAEEAIDRAAQLQRERDLQDAVVAAEERTRIARELHDIVAHSISMVTVQTQAVRRRLGGTIHAKLPTLPEKQPRHARRWWRCAGCSGCCTPMARVFRSRPSRGFASWRSWLSK